MTKQLVAVIVFVAVFGIAGAPATALGAIDHMSPIHILKGGAGPVCFPGFPCE